MRIFYRVISLALAISSLSNSDAFADQKWSNPADRYQKVHQNYDGATCPIPQDGIKHFAYFTRDRDRMRGHPFLKNDRFSGAQIMYAWRALEPSKGEYDFSTIRADLEYLKEHDKRLFIQLQDVSFSAQYKAVPDYILRPEYDGGLVPYIANGETIGWIAKRWNPHVQERFGALLQALGDKFDGEIEGLNLQETAIDVSTNLDPSFSPSSYAAAIRGNMRRLKQAFPNSTTMQYANFMPGEWLPWEDAGYLQSIYDTGEALGVGLGTPDLMMRRRAQLNHPLAMMHEGTFSVPLGIAIQDGNYAGRTGADAHFNARIGPDVDTTRIIPKLHAFAADFLQVDYMFWVDQAPYFKDLVLPCFANEVSD